MDKRDGKTLGWTKFLDGNSMVLGIHGEDDVGVAVSTLLTHAMVRNGDVQHSAESLYTLHLCNKHDTPFVEKVKVHVLPIFYRQINRHTNRPHVRSSGSSQLWHSVIPYGQNSVPEVSIGAN